MPSKTPATSVRLPIAIAHLVKVHAEEQGLSHHATILRLIKIGLERVTHPVTTPAPAPAPVARPRKPKARWSLTAAGVPLGPKPYVPIPKKPKK